MWARVLALVLALGLIIGCSASPPQTDNGGDDDGDQGTTPVTGLRFDLSDAVGLQIGGLSGLSVSSASSGLVKLMTSGELADALAEGSVQVLDFFIRNGQVYVLFALGTAPGGCVLGVIGEAGEVLCVDGELSSIEIRSLQFDAWGGVYYRGVLSDGRSVIRRSVDGVTTDYLVATDAINIENFLVTRNGIVLAQGSSSGSIGGSSWIRAINESGGITNFEYGMLLGYLPDGTILFGLDGLRRFLLHDGIEVDPRPYCDGPQANRLQAEEFSCAQEVWQAHSLNLVYQTSSEVFGVTPNGLFRFFPTLERIETPINRLTNAAIRSGIAVIAGYYSDSEPAAYVVDLATGGSKNILQTRRIEVLRLLLELDRERVLLYGLDLQRNQPVLAEYSLRLDILEVVDIGTELASGFQTLDLTVSHVPPEVRRSVPQPSFAVEALVGFDEGVVLFDPSQMSGIQWVDRLSWDFGDGTTMDQLLIPGTGSEDSLHISHRYAAGGTYTASVTATSFVGESGVVVADVEVPEPTRAAAIAAGPWIGFALDTMNRLWSWGSGAIGNGTYGPEVLPVEIELTADAARLRTMCSEYRTTVIVDEAGRAWSWGFGEEGNLGDGGVATRLYPGPVTMPDGVTFQQVGCGQDFTIALDDDGQLWAWGRGGTPIPTPISVPDGVAFTSISTGPSHSIALDQDGVAWEWYGLGTGSGAPVPVSMPEEVTFQAVSAGGDFSLALDLDGQAWAWGDNRDGKLGTDPDVTRQLTPAPVAMPDGVIFAQVSAGFYYSLALDTMNQAWAWGENAAGQLGDGTLDASRLPVPVMMPEGSSFVDVDAGGEFSLAVDANGGVWSWGYNYYGQLGNGSDGFSNLRTAPGPVGSPVSSWVMP